MLQMREIESKQLQLLGILAQFQEEKCKRHFKNYLDTLPPRDKEIIQFSIVFSDDSVVDFESLE